MLARRNCLAIAEIAGINPSSRFVAKKTSRLK